MRLKLGRARAPRPPRRRPAPARRIPSTAAAWHSRDLHRQAKRSNQQVRQRIQPRRVRAACARSRSADRAARAGSFVWFSSDELRWYQVSTPGRSVAPESGGILRLLLTSGGASRTPASGMPCRSPGQADRRLQAPVGPSLPQTGHHLRVDPHGAWPHSRIAFTPTPGAAFSPLSSDGPHLYPLRA